METSPDSSAKNNRLWMILAIIFMAVSAYLFYQVNSLKEALVIAENNTVEALDERDAITEELEQMLDKYDTLTVENAEMQAKIDEQKSKIEKLLKEAKDKNWTIAKLRKETESLREIMKGYLVTIDSLNTANQTLIAEKREISQALGEERAEKEELIKVKGDLEAKVKIGAKLEAVDLIAQAQRVKSKGVHRETDRADRVDVIKTCFTVSRNELTKPGAKAIHLRIVKPNGEVFAESQTEENMFEFEGVKGLYSLKREIIYDNEELDLCYYYEIPSGLALPAGKYLVEAYAEDYLLGTTDFELK